MLTNSQAFSGFSVNNIEEAKKFYSEILGLKIEQDWMGLHLHTKNNSPIFIYEKTSHSPATFTILNFVVEDIDKAIEELNTKGIKFEHYTGDIQTDEKGVLRGKSANMGPDIAWFKDPAGNILSIIEN